MNRGRINTIVIVQAGFLTALSIVLTRFFSIMVPLVAGLPTLRLGFGELPIILSGLLFGPIVGGMTGLIADLIGAWAFPQGPFFIGFTLSSMLWGILPGIYGNYLRKKAENGNPFTFKKVFLIVAICTVLISTILNTYWLTILYGKGFFVLLPGRILSGLIKMPIVSYLITLLVKLLKTKVVL